MSTTWLSAHVRTLAAKRHTVNTVLVVAKAERPILTSD